MNQKAKVRQGARVEVGCRDAPHIIKYEFSPLNTCLRFLHPLPLQYDYPPQKCCLFDYDFWTYKVFMKNCGFFQECSTFCSISPSPALGCFWLYTKCSSNRSDCTLRFRTKMSWSPTCRGLVAVNWKKKTQFFLNTALNSKAPKLLEPLNKSVNLRLI